MDLGDFGPKSSSTDSKYDSNDDYLNDDEVVRYQPKKTEREHARKIASARHESYDSGETRDEDWAESLAGMERGTTAELVTALLYDECSFDDSISAGGDDGSDGQLRIDGEAVEIDVKSDTKLQSDVPFQIELLVATHHVNERDAPPVFVNSYVSESLDEVRLRGWAWTEDLVESEPQPAYSGGHQNYAVSIDELNPMPKPDEDTMAEHDNAEVVRE